MAASIAPDWPGAIWVGEVEERISWSVDRIALQDADRHASARMLIRRQGTPLGFVEIPIADSCIDAAQLRSKIGVLPAAEPRDDDAETGTRPPVSVVICTRDRPGQLDDALCSLAKLDYPGFEVVIVDNNPPSGLTRRVVDAPIAGLARARNIGARAARHEIIAFTDDDVLIDAGWLAGLVRGFNGNVQTGCVTGIVASGEINSLTQWYFDQRVTWARNCRPTRYSMAAPPADDPMFPFQVGTYGTGANFALRRSVLFGLGGFDESFGAGSATGGAEDIDMFVRVLLAGHELKYEPSALIWHRHRSDLDALTQQSQAYGKGLGAWLTKLAVDPRTAWMLLPRAIAGVRHLSSINKMPLTTAQAQLLGGLGAVERRAILAGPAAFARARLTGGRSRPLRAFSRPQTERLGAIGG